MRKFLRYKAELKCPKCGHAGLAAYEGPFASELMKVTLPPGFSKQTSGAIRCDKCGATVRTAI